MTWVAVGITLAGLAVGAYNTNQTAKRMDNEAAAGIQQQSRRQRVADAKVAEEVERLKASSSSDERAEAMQSHLEMLRRGKGNAEAGLTPAIGSDAFREGAAEAATGVQDYGRNFAGLMSRIEAPGLQRMGEGFGYGQLQTDLSLIGRQSRGDAFLNEMRMKGIRNNPWLDLAAGAMVGGGGAMMAGGSGGSGGNTVGNTGSNTKTGGSIGKNYRKGP